MQQVLVNGKAVEPSKILCVGRNFVEHIEELGNDLPDDMVVFNKPNSSITDKLCAVHQEPLHYEAELCFVIENQQLAAVGIGLDLTKRKLQSSLKSQGLPWEKAKAFDGSALFSQFEMIAPSQINESLSLELWIDNKLAQTGHVGLMIYKPEQIRQSLLAYTQLCDGDIIMTGTPKGVGQVKQGSRLLAKVKLGNKTIVEKQWLAE